MHNDTLSIRIGIIRLWDTQTEKVKTTFTGHTQSVAVVKFSPRGLLLASGADDGTLRLWHTHTGTLLYTFDIPKSSVLAVAFSPDGKTVAGACWKKIYLWDVRTGELNNSLTSHSGWHRALTFSPDGQILASGNDNRTIIMWDLKLLQD